MKLKLLPLLILAGLNCSCQMGYLMKSGYGQMKLLSSRVPIEEALQDPRMDEEKKSKLRLAEEAHRFAESTLQLKKTKNYSSYVELDEPYVTYVVSAAPKWELKHFQWSYPLMGKMPYKGYFKKLDAHEEELKLQQSQNLDTYLRGVTAYSTLGWFNDPVLSSMLRYKDYDLVNTIIHELVHATIYVRHAADFNERLATFIGNKGTELFYLNKEGADSPTLRQIQKENEDHHIFSEFISLELKRLETWYKNLPESQRQEKTRTERIGEIQKNFLLHVAPRLQTDAFKSFAELSLNNASLLVYKTYLQDLSDFEYLYEKVGRDFQRLLHECRKLEDNADPESALKALVTRP